MLRMLLLLAGLSLFSCAHGLSLNKSGSNQAEKVVVLESGVKVVISRLDVLPIFIRYGDKAYKIDSIEGKIVVKPLRPNDYKPPYGNY